LSSAAYQQDPFGFQSFNNDQPKTTSLLDMEDDFGAIDSARHKPVMPQH